MTHQAFNPELHKQMMIKILVDVFKKLNGKLAFKGGTCAFLFYDLPRLSLDLDFDVLEKWTGEDVEDLKLILSKHGKMKEFKDKKFTTFFLLDYQPGAPNIKIELNKRVWQNNIYKNIWFLGVEMKIADESTLATNKIVALTDRKSFVARDLFDVYYFLTLGWPLNDKLIKERTDQDLKSYLRYLSSFIKKNYHKKNVLQGLGEVLDEKQKIWAKRNLIQETVKAIEKIVN